MPWITIHILEGRSEATIALLIEKVTATVATTTNSPKENIRVMVTEIPKSHWGIAGKTAKELGR